MERRPTRLAPRHALDDGDLAGSDDTLDASVPLEPRHGASRWNPAHQLRLLVVPAVVATVITGVVMAVKPTPTTAAEPLAQISVAAPSGQAVNAAPTSGGSASSEADEVEPSQAGTPEPSQASTPAASTASSPAASTSAAPTTASSPSASPSASASARAASAGTRWTTTSVNVRASASSSAKVLATVPAGTSVQVTSATARGYQQVVWSKSTGWISAKYLSTKKSAVTPRSAGVSRAPCKSGSSVERGLVPNAIAVHRSVCAAFPSVTRYGGRRGGGGDHGTGRAIDIMVSGAAGWEVANWLRANAAQLGITEVIYAQRIWTTQRGREGWRPMRSRGSATANHYDHVHVTVR